METYIDVAPGVMTTLDVEPEEIKFLDVAPREMQTLDATREVMHTLDVEPEVWHSLDVEPEVMHSLDAAQEVMHSLDVAPEVMHSLDVPPEEVVVAERDHKKRHKKKKSKKTEAEAVVEPKVEEVPVEQVVEGGGGVGGKDDGMDKLARELEELEKKELRARKRRPGSFWKKPPTFVYADNFGFGINGYQSMIEYLDLKDSGGLANKDNVHLPSLEERCLTKYHSTAPFHWYQNSEIDRYIDKGEKIRTQIRQNDAVGFGNVLRRTHTNWSMARKWVQLVKHSSVIDYRKMHNKGSEFEDTVYRSPTPVKVFDYRALTPKPRSVTPKPRYVDDLTSEFASVVQTLAQSRMEHEQALVARRQKLHELDDKFENTVDHIYDQMKRISQRADSMATNSRDPRNIDVNEVTARNRVRRAEELRNMMDCVSDLTEMDSARNVLRSSLRSLDDEVMGLSGRVDDMRHLHASERIKNLENDLELDRLKSDLAARSHSRASSVVPLDDPEDDIAMLTYRRPHIPLYEYPSLPERITPRPRDPLHRDDVISDVRARILNKAGEICDRSSEQRRINSRSRYVNIYHPRPETADRELIVPPTKTELNIDYMAKTLASHGACRRRFDIDDELEGPYSSLNTNAQRDYCDHGGLGTIRQHPSNSRRVRYAISRARARNSVLGH
ncbi:hypothetical protein Pmani_024964 [Petrolisthes manimaculis]|uniref:Paramyosin, short form n=1 Tax=Petrolisthes manimaculis TaxID=1843537 RepID=A0AAE1TYT8_9EUCA|nr:hypothetical protein Pmani_024964 [Petrolisthes manimaculis]